MAQQQGFIHRWAQMDTDLLREDQRLDAPLLVGASISYSAVRPLQPFADFMAGGSMPENAEEAEHAENAEDAEDAEDGENAEDPQGIRYWNCAANERLDEKRFC
jgi:hypothetical protein